MLEFCRNAYYKDGILSFDKGRDFNKIARKLTAKYSGRRPKKRRILNKIIKKILVMLIVNHSKRVINEKEDKAV